jgi:hypothetical protein
MAEPILAIDPGTTKSAYVVYQDGNILEKGILENPEMLKKIRDGFSDYLINDMAMEMIASYGMAVGKSVFFTCVWIGRFVEAWGRDFHYIYRKDVKMCLCGATKAKDSNIRQAIMDRYGSTREKAIGLKAEPGPLYGVSKDIWAAIGVAITFDEDGTF